MITAEKLKTLTTFTAPALSRAIQLAGYKGDTFTGAKFLGITNGGQFCYNCTYEDEFGNEDSCHVYLKHNTDGSVTADY